MYILITAARSRLSWSIASRSIGFRGVQHGYDADMLITRTGLSGFVQLCSASSAIDSNV